MSDDMDLDIDDDFGDEVPQKASMKDMWDNNPFLKIGALVIVAILAGFLYTSVFSGGDEEDPKDASIIRNKGTAQGQVGEETSDVYKKAIEDTNKQRADYAQISGGSALPTPIGRPEGLIETTDNEEEGGVTIDPLQEWRKTAEARRFEIDFTDEPEETEPLPEVVPIVEPIRPQTEVLQDPELSNKLMQQMQLVIATRVPKPAELKNVTNIESAYKQAEKEAEIAANDATGSVSDGNTVVFDGSGSPTGGESSPLTEDREEGKVLIPGGEVVYAQLLTELNSDVPGPALAHVLSGPLKGGRAIGSFSLQDEYLTITFNRIVKDDITYNVDTIALDPNTTLNGLSSDVDKHYFTRIILPAAAEFISGFGEAVTQTDTQAVSSDGSTVSSTQDLDIEQELAKGASEAFDKVSDIVDEGSDRPITVKVYQGTPMGLLFLTSLREDDGDQKE